MMAGEIGAVIVCDDVRREQTNKDILVGVYAGDIIVTSFPAIVTAAHWIEFTPGNTGLRTLRFRVSVNDMPPAEMKFEIQVAELGPMGLVLPPTHMPVEKPSDLSLHIWSGNDWALLKKKAITQGLVAFPFGRPTLAGG
jgi:hypothetical protein